MEDFGTFDCKGFEGHIRTWRVYADVTNKKEIEFIRLQFGASMLPGPALRPRECLQPHERKALLHVRQQLTLSKVGEDDFEVIDEEDKP